MTLDNFWHLDFGNIATLLGVLLTMYMFHVSNVKRITKMEFKVNLMWRRFAHRFNMSANLEEDNRDDDNGFSHS